jgi:hypothetical protein
MSLVVKPSSGDVPELENGLWTATIMNVKQVKLEQPDQFGKTDKLEISLEIEVDDDIVSLDPRVNIAWSEKATLFKIAQAAGLDPDPYDSFDVEQLVGAKLKVLTEQEEGKWPRVMQWQKVPARKLTRRQEPETDEDEPPFSTAK